MRGIINQWFKCYLTQRTQFVEIDNNKSNPLPIQCGVPQGSILGPLLYLLYVNDICNSCKGNILSFADDTTSYTSHSDIQQLYTTANMHIKHVFEWFCADKLSLNANKNKYIVIKPHQKRSNVNRIQYSYR